MKKAHTLAAGALLALTGAAGYAAGPDAIGPGAYDRLSTDFASNTIVVWWGQDATQAMRTAAISAIDGSVVATDDEGAQILSVGVGLSQARVLLEQFPSNIISTVESTDAFVGNQFELDAHMLEVLTVPANTGEAMLIPVVLDGGVYTLELIPRSVRSDDFQLLVEQEDGSLLEIEAPPSNTFRGRVVEMPGSDLAASINANGLTATILLNDELESGWFIEPLNEVVDGAPSDVYVVYDGAASRETASVCGGALIPDNPVVGIGAQQGGTQRGLLTAEMAYDADFQFYQQNGSSTTNTTNDINNIQNAVNVIYERDTGVTFVITQIIIRTSSGSNPYTTNDPGGLLDQFRSQWLNNHGGVQRDLAHLMTGRNLNGGVIGVAWLSGVCTSFGYGLSQSRFTGNFNMRVALTAHEVGHNFSAGHCSGGGCFIMCASINGCSGIGLPNFGTSSSNSISNYAAGRPCLDSGPPPNQPPTVQVTTPINNSTVNEGSNVLFSAIADDPEQGNVGADLVWSSNLDGVFATGNVFNYAGLSAGTHTITASVTDNGGLSDSDSVTLNVNGGGGGSAPDQPARPTTQDLGNGTARINWVDLPNETEWDVQREEKTGGVWTNRTTVASGLPQDTVTYDDPAGFGIWRYRIRARNSAGNSPWSAWRFRRLRDPNPPTAPTGMSATDLGGGQAQLAWTDTSDSEFRFQVQRQEKIAGTWTNQGIIAQLPENSESYTDAPGAGVYRYRVRARNTSGFSSWTPFGDGRVDITP
jgi:metallopeptidase family M12-like protein